jgi:diadenosine tetraphosphate (Ap4A) HIT family hydrolase
LQGSLYRSGLRCEGVNLRLADGEVADQEEVPHVHLHVIPRCRGARTTAWASFSARTAKRSRDGETRKRRRADLVRDVL